jgi:hypothetical protein
MADLGKALVFLGLLVAAGGAILMLVGRSHFPLGRLPGDIVYRGKNTTVYFPLASSILASVLVTVLLYVISRLRR